MEPLPSAPACPTPSHLTGEGAAAPLAHLCPGPLQPSPGCPRAMMCVCVLILPDLAFTDRSLMMLLLFVQLTFSIKLSHLESCELIIHIPVCYQMNLFQHSKVPLFSPLLITREMQIIIQAYFHRASFLHPLYHVDLFHQ